MTHDLPEDRGDDPGSFDEFLARFLGARGPVRRVDLSKLMSAEAQQVADVAVRRALESGGADVDTVHLLWALLRYQPTRDLVGRTDANPDQLTEVIDQAVAQAPRTVRGSARLTPAAKRTLLDALQIARATGSSSITPEHLLFALAVNPDSPVSQLMRDSGITPPALQKAAGPVPAAERHEEEPSSTPTLDEFGTDMTALAREGRLDPVVGRDAEVEQCIEVLARGARTTRSSSATRAWARPRSPRGSPSASSTTTSPRRCAGAGWSSSTWPGSWRAPATGATSKSA